MARAAPKTIGNKIAPARFILFVLVLAAGVTAALGAGRSWAESTMIGFDAAGILFLLSCIPLLSKYDSRHMRAQAAANDARRTILLVITALVLAVILMAVATELGFGDSAGPEPVQPWIKMLVLATLLIAWLFSNMVYALHYAHLSYRGEGEAGIRFPGSKAPDYADFIYFAFTLGMTFQTSDVEITDAGIRRLVTLHCLAAFVFNLGVLAFTINVLGG